MQRSEHSSSVPVPPAQEVRESQPPQPSRYTALTPITAYLVGPLALLLCYRSWKSMDNPWKGEFWNGGTFVAIAIWAYLCLFMTVVGIARGDFRRLFTGK